MAGNAGPLVPTPRSLPGMILRPTNHPASRGELMSVHNLPKGDIAWHGTCTPAEIETVRFGQALTQVEIVARDGGGTIFYTIDNTDPTPTGGTTRVIPAGVIGSAVHKLGDSAGPVKILTTASCVVDVQDPS